MHPVVRRLLLELELELELVLVLLRQVDRRPLFKSRHQSM
jgi:hypothetical protein